MSELVDCGSHWEVRVRAELGECYYRGSQADCQAWQTALAAQLAADQGVDPAETEHRSWFRLMGETVLPPLPAIDTDFSEYTTGQQPSDWTKRVGASDHVWSVVADAAYTGGKYVRDTTSTNLLAVLACDALDGALDSDQRLLANSSSSSNTQQLLAARLRITPGGNVIGYRLQWSSPNLQLFESYLSDNPSSFGEEVAGTVLASVTKSFLINDPFWMRLLVEGDRIRAKAWDADEPEPGAWDIDWTGEVRQGMPGHHGIGAIRSTGTRRFDVFQANLSAPIGLGGKLPNSYAEGDTFGCLGGGAILLDGRRLVTWRQSRAHIESRGVLRGAISSPNGVWNEFPLYSHESLDVRHPMPAVSPSGTILIPGNHYDYTTTWSGQMFVLRGTSPRDLTYHAVADAFDEINVVTAPPVEVSAGTWVLPVYGRDAGGESALFSRLLRSTDDGLTWSTVSTIAEGALDDDSQWLEPNITQLTNGDLICLMRRGNEINVYQSFSSDGGETWSTPVIAYAGAGPPAILQLSGGTLVTAYRATSGSSRGGYRTSTDGGQTWSEETLVYTAAQSWQHGQLAEISPTRALLYYWRRAGTVPGGEAAVGFTRVIDV